MSMFKQASVVDEVVDFMEKRQVELYEQDSTSKTSKKEEAISLLLEAVDHFETAGMSVQADIVSTLLRKIAEYNCGCNGEGETCTCGPECPCQKHHDENDVRNPGKTKKEKDMYKHYGYMADDGEEVWEDKC